MRWTVEPYPSPGDTRTRRRFALFPRRCGNEVYWLEWIIEEQMYFVSWGSSGWETFSCTQE